jgi:hypothetical protein
METSGPPNIFHWFFCEHSRFASKSMQQDQRHKVVPMCFFGEILGIDKKRGACWETHARGWLVVVDDDDALWIPNVI